jgi:hypothetical protein
MKSIVLSVSVSNLPSGDEGRIWKQVDCALGEEELALSEAEFAERYVRPAAAQVLRSYRHAQECFKS